jgi:ABC-2 type transport system permease protein
MYLSRNNLTRSVIRVSAFLLKEIFGIMRQPMLLVTLVLGPFLILLFFGIGFRNQPRALRTLFVVEEGSPLNETIQRYATSLGPQLIYAGVSNDLEEAKEKLGRNEVDLIALIPPDPYNTIRSNNQAVFELYHKEIDPFQSDYIRVFSRVYVDEVNRRVLRYATSAGQLNVSEIDEKLNIVRESIDTFKEALAKCAEALTEVAEAEECNTETLNRYAQELDQNLDELEMELGNNANLSDSAQRWLKGETGSDNRQEDLQSALNRMIRNANELSESEEVNQKVDDYLDQIETLTELDTDLVNIQDRIAEFVGISPLVLVSPFRSEVTNIGTIVPNVTDYFAPAVIVMLLQHLTVTFAALSLVREKLLGSVELFNVSPISAIETLFGKYLSYLVFGGSLAIVLLTLLVAGMRVPVLGRWTDVGLTILILIYTSLGIGFIISLISSTDTQAVQYAMIMLLTSVFFSGFILELHTLWQPVRLISWMLPATYGILLLRDVMLRGNPIDTTLLLQFATMGTLLFIIAWFLLRRSMVNI